MCITCWEDAGKPTERTPQTGRLVELIAELYKIHGTGGPLHVVVDDWNLGGVITPYYDNSTDTELDELYYEGYPVSDCHPESPVVAEGLGVSTRALCDEIAALLSGMTQTQRYAAMAYADGFAEAPTEMEK